MAEFNDFDIEIENEKESTVEQFSGNVATAGVPVTITPSNGRPIKSFFIDVPSVMDIQAPNAIADGILYSMDGGTTYFSLSSGEWIYMPVEAGITDLRIDTNNDGTTYQISTWS